MVQCQVRTVRNEKAIKQICDAPGLWLVTTHQYQIVKVQVVEGAAYEPADEQMAGGGVRIRIRRARHGELVSQMIQRNGQWLVFSQAGIIAGIAFVDKPLSLETQEAEAEASEPAETEDQEEDQDDEAPKPPDPPKPRKRRSSTTAATTESVAASQSQS